MAYFVERRILFKKHENKLEEIYIKEGLFSNANVVAFYFGAKWCSECVKFTPILKNFYDKIKAKNESFELVYVSSDKTEDELKEFVLEFHGDWFVFWMDESEEFEDNFNHMWGLRDYFKIQGIPTLVVTIDNNEDLESSDGIIDILSKGEDAFEEWKNRTTKPERSEEESVVKWDIKPECCKISKFKAWEPKPPAKILEGLTLVKKMGKMFTEEPADFAIGQTEIVAFYFAAAWCGPCLNFTPILKDFYKYVKSKNYSFEIVFFSDDDSEKKMKKHMQELHGNWYGVFCKDASKKEFIKRMFAIQGIPTLTIVNKYGDKIVENAVDEIENKGFEALNFWLEGESAETEDNSSEQSLCTLC